MRWRVARLKIDKTTRRKPVKDAQEADKHFNRCRNFGHVHVTISQTHVEKCFDWLNQGCTLDIYPRVYVIFGKRAKKTKNKQKKAYWFPESWWPRSCQDCEWWTWLAPWHRTSPSWRKGPHWKKWVCFYSAETILQLPLLSNFGSLPALKADIITTAMGSTLHLCYFSKLQWLCIWYYWKSRCKASLSPCLCIEKILWFSKTGKYCIVWQVQMMLLSAVVLHMLFLALQRCFVKTGRILFFMISNIVTCF